MAQVFTGTYRRALDSKNRVMVPSEVRDLLEVGDRKGLYLIPSRNYVLCWPQSYLDSYAAQHSATAVEQSRANRKLYSQMIFRPFDGNGRIVLPGPVAERFSEKKEVLIAGVGVYLELWDPDAFEADLDPLDID